MSGWPVVVHAARRPGQRRRQRPGQGPVSGLSRPQVEYADGPRPNHLAYGSGRIPAGGKNTRLIRMPNDLPSYR